MRGPHAEYEGEVLERHESHGPKGRLSVSIVTPRGSIFARPVDELTAPGALGEFGVLPGHLPFLAALKAGVLAVRDGQRRETLAVGRGYLQVGAGDRIEVLVESAQPSSDIDVAGAQRDQDEVLAEMKKGAAQGAEFAALQARLDWARARLDAAAAAHGAHGKD